MKKLKRRTARDSANHSLPLHSSNKNDEAPSPGSERKKRRSQFTVPPYFLYAVLLVLFIYLAWTTLKARSMNYPFYIPQQLQLSSDISVDKSTWEWPLIHIVHTRFMQEQANLTALGEARLALFQTFCLPTMQHQTSQQFLWMIKTDPNLDSNMMKALIEELSPYPNFYLVASNANFRINDQFPGAWRDGAEGRDLAQSRVYTGNQTRLEIAMAVQDRFPILETRLDADDGLHVQFIEQMQTQALNTFRGNKNVQWMYWCARRHLEWHWMENAAAKDLLKEQIETYGVMTGVQHSKLCITPGVTAGFPVGVPERQVPVFAHDKLVERIQDLPPGTACGMPKSKDCLQFIETHIFEAVRSRTPTSAGMLRIEAKDYRTEPFVYYAYWNMLYESFAVQREHVGWMNSYLSDNLIEIAEENLMGQCTTGHSCKEKAKVALQNLIAQRHNISVMDNGGR